MSFLHHPGMRTDRRSDVPVALELTGSASLPPPGIVRDLMARLPPAWVGMSGYLVAGIFLGLVLILAITLSRGSGDTAAAIAAPTTTSGTITDNVTRLHAREIGESCWQDVEKDGPARLTVSLEVGADGKVRYAVASGESPAMRSCIETHVKSWEFLPQAQSTTMALPFEVDRR
jgi:hypothetical protein